MTTKTLKQIVELGKKEATPVGASAGNCRTFGLIEGRTYEIVGVEHDRGDLFLKMEPVEDLDGD